MPSGSSKGNMGVGEVKLWRGARTNTTDETQGQIHRWKMGELIVGQIKC